MNIFNVYFVLTWAVHNQIYNWEAVIKYSYKQNHMICLAFSMKTNLFNAKF